MQFLNPALLASALLFAVPLAIHLLNRQRHKKRPWAAMEFLLRAYQKQRNRLRNENLLLLLLRCLVPIVLALAIARPTLQHAPGLLSTAGIVHHVVVLDGSFSMGLRQDGSASPFEKARALVGRLLDRFDQNPQRNDKVTLVLAGVRPRFLVRADLDLGTARAQWLQMQKPEDAAAELDDALRQVADALDEGKDADAQVYVFTDAQVRSLGKALAGSDGKPADDLVDTARDLVERIQKRPGTQLHWIDVGPFGPTTRGGQADNVQIADLRVLQPAAVLRSPVEVVATVKNRGQATANCEVTLDVDGQEPMRKVVTVPPGSEAEADFQLTFRELGRRRVRAAVNADALTADDERFLSVEVRDRLRVLLVDGEANGDPLQSHRYLWQSILDPDPVALPTFAVEAVDAVALLGGRVQPKNFDLTVLADVDRLNAAAVKALTDALAAGRGVAVLLGEHADAESYNLHLHAAGEGPQPFRLLRPLGGAPGSSIVRAASIVADDHPLLREFEESVYREVLQAIPVWRWHGVAADSLAKDASVVLAVTDVEHTPLLVARPFLDGKVVYLTSTLASQYRADRWNRLDDPMVAFPLLHGLAKWLALPAVDPFAASVGAELTCALPARPSDVEVLRPDRDGRPKAPLVDEAQPLPGGRFRSPPLVDTPFAGFYVLECTLERESGKENVQLPFAVNVHPDEGELKYADHETIRQALGIARVLDGLPAAAESVDTDADDELGATFLLATLLFVLVEAALARHVAVRRN